MQAPNTRPHPKVGPRERKMLLAAVALASGVTLECSSAGIGLFDSVLGCQPSASFSSSCGIVAVTTNCGVSISCGDAGTGGTTCTFPTPASDCEVTVSLEDGTQRKLSVSVYAHGPDCGSAGVFGVALPLQCEGSDAGDVEAGDAMIDATEDTTSDVAVDVAPD